MVDEMEDGWSWGGSAVDREVLGRGEGKKACGGARSGENET
jgi:hypothetical protein